MKIIVRKNEQSIKTNVVFVSKQGVKKCEGELEVLQGVFKGKWAETLFVPTTKDSQNTLFIGLGNETYFSYEKARRLAAVVYTSLKSRGQNTAKINIETLYKKNVSDWGKLVQAVTEGLILKSYKLEEYKSNNKKEEEKTICFCLPESHQQEAEKAVSKGVIIAESTNIAKDIATQPGNYMTPSLLAEQAQKHSQNTKIKVTVWDKKKLEQEKMGGILGVSAGSSEEPRFIIMEYKGATNPAEKPICFVGKGVTFDTGGISLKPGHAMDEMKFDMCGSTVVIGSLLAIEKLKLKVNVLGLIPATENMPGPSATKPGDILTARNKKTMEILNTDAEGRLILADALSYASEQKPQVIFDTATLTGAVLMALGNIYTGLFTKNEDLYTKIMTAAKNSGERVWRLPLMEEHTKDMDSTIADVSNLSFSRGAGSSTAAAFLEHFVDKNIPWAHFDIAGTSYNVEKRLEYCNHRTASGAMVRTFIELAQLYES